MICICCYVKYICLCCYCRAVRPKKKKVKFKKTYTQRNYYP